jgi:hypothetical protein
MTMLPLSRPNRLRATRAALALSLGVIAALLISCSGSSKGLIPVADAGPLQGDFETVAQAAESGDGNCAATEAALLKTEQDFAALPSSVDAGLRRTLQQGIENLHKRALSLCAQPLPQSTITTTPPKTTSSTTTTPPPAETQTTDTQTTPAPETNEPSGPGGGTPAPGEPRVGEVEGGGESESPGGVVGGASPGGGQEAGK